MKITKVSIYGTKEIGREVKDFVDIYWENDEDEFGHIYLYGLSNGKITMDTEFMSKEFVKKVFDKLIESTYE